ncbi:FAD assembly factor SdhE [Acetobacter conturbans]|uniref:FAD assembly factor SdhE n=1 Tax=Acetobacter conturbans TaxID=1737472 RepID=A0ABX0JXL9_9PROT|nr:succinate dehydrogenase assembly factor 2 [Acetobacter conturbans]NHN88028.1 succinate dehydrogenase assembly factor 2 [Acetobacter conturbans]
MEQNETVSAQAPERDLETRRRRLVFRARHRGTFETDILIGEFVDRHVGQMDAAALTDMEAVLELPDPDLSDWLFGRLPLPKECETPMLLAMVRAARERRGESRT